MSETEKKEGNKVSYKIGEIIGHIYLVKVMFYCEVRGANQGIKLYMDGQDYKLVSGHVIT